MPSTKLARKKSRRLILHCALSSIVFCDLLAFAFVSILTICGNPASAQFWDSRASGSIIYEVNSTTSGRMQQCRFDRNGQSAAGNDESCASETAFVNGADASAFNNCYVNAISICLQIFFFILGAPILFKGLKRMAAGSQDALQKVLIGTAAITFVFLTPGCINWLYACISQQQS